MLYNYFLFCLIGCLWILFHFTLLSFSFECLGLKVECWLRDLARRPSGLRCARDIAGWIRSRFPHHPQAWCVGYFPANLGRHMETISLPSLGLVRNWYPYEPWAWLVLPLSASSYWFALSDWDDFFLYIYVYLLLSLFNRQFNQLWSFSPSFDRLITDYMWSPDSWDSTASVMESILTVWSKTSQHYLTILKIQYTAWQYTMSRGSLSIIRLVTQCLYSIHYNAPWRSVITVVLMFTLMVWKLNTYLRCVDAREARAGMEETNACAG